MTDNTMQYLTSEYLTSMKQEFKNNIVTDPFYQADFQFETQEAMTKKSVNQHKAIWRSRTEEEKCHSRYLIFSSHVLCIFLSCVLYLVSLITGFCEPLWSWNGLRQVDYQSPIWPNWGSNPQPLDQEYNIWCLWLSGLEIYPAEATYL